MTGIPASHRRPDSATRHTHSKASRAVMFSLPVETLEAIPSAATWKDKCDSVRTKKPINGGNKHLTTSDGCDQDFVRPVTVPCGGVFLLGGQRSHPNFTLRPGPSGRASNNATYHNSDQAWPLTATRVASSSRPRATAGPSAVHRIVSLPEGIHGRDLRPIFRFDASSTFASSRPKIRTGAALRDAAQHCAAPRRGHESRFKDEVVAALSVD